MTLAEEGSMGVPLRWLALFTLGCGSALPEGATEFGGVRWAMLAPCTVPTEDGGTLQGVFGALQSSRNACNDGFDDAAPEPARIDCVQWLDAIEAHGSCPESAANARSDMISFLVLDIDDLDDVEGLRSPDPLLSPCYGRSNPNDVEDIEIDGRISLAEDLGTSIVLDVDTDVLSAEIPARFCR